MGWCCWPHEIAKSSLQTKSRWAGKLFANTNTDRRQTTKMSIAGHSELSRIKWSDAGHWLISRAVSAVSVSKSFIWTEQNRKNALIQWNILLHLFSNLYEPLVPRVSTFHSIWRGAQSWGGIKEITKDYYLNQVKHLLTPMPYNFLS